MTRRQRETALNAIFWCFELGPDRAFDGKKIEPDCEAAAEAAVSAFRAGPSQEEKEELERASIVLDGALGAETPNPAGYESGTPLPNAHVACK
jgi:hypothetical protein